ncbi:MAG: hypothetical protein H8E44_29855 [Planctomycetes bacterium]|nr:hypothetical protein [Planctomycetota bacterium]MBL7043581.1 hypothetical protein [Pirellulaceae bacterium]
MSGLAAGFGAACREDVQAMLDKIAHRGPAWSGICEHQRATLAQNYCRADMGACNEGGEVAPAGFEGESRKICYDGQIGDGARLADDLDIPGGPWWDERLLLHLYRLHGPDMLGFVRGAIFAFVISDGDSLLAARDVLGIKTLFYGRKNGALYFASELKSILAVTDDVYEFPAGHFMDGDGRLTRFADLPKSPRIADIEPTEAVREIKEIIWNSVRSSVDFSTPTAGLLSGGLDSSVVCCLASRLCEDWTGGKTRLKTFAIGLGESEDIQNARLMADHIGSEHHELIVDLDRVLEALPEVIYYLESFDPSLVRSAVSNYLISRHAREHGIDQLLSGEGGDEIFCGYTYLKDFPPEELAAEQLKCLGYLHNNASLRLDRMNQCHSVRVVAPLISGKLLDYALHLPPEYKQKPEGDGKIEKWIFRKAYESVLPDAIAWRGKQEFSQGSGSAGVLPAHFEGAISDEEFAHARREHPLVRSKEELYYFRIFAENFGTDRAVDTVGQWVSL